MEAMKSATTSTDEAAVVATVLDYFEGWFDGDPARMGRALHPELAKRPSGVPGSLGTLTAQEMIDATAAGVGRTRDVPDRQIEVKIVDLFGDIASTVVWSAVYREYLHLVRTPEGWKIANALWQWMPGQER
jgi:Putative lumazine-binding